ncbi:MAG: hypothetical protein PHH13_01875 [Candidatus Peribacteraceae bacterium]|nr:hypothetical protein [Candidatus Peribacteraceae bacterium]
MRKVPAIILGILFAPLIIYFSLYGILWLLGYEFAEGPDVLAERLIAEERSAKDCYRYVTLDPWFRPTTRELREQCVREYAKLTSDPTACELLLPSDYGLSCIGDIWGKLIDENNCHWYKNDSVRCFEGVALTPHIYNCQEEAAASSLPDECRHRIAFKEKKADLCDAITQPTLRTICKVRIGAWEKYPNLRGSFYFGQSDSR